MYWANPKDKDVKDAYGCYVPTEFLGEETIVSAVFTAEQDSGLTVQNLPPEGNLVQAYFSGGNLGFHNIHLRIATATRQQEYKFVLWVIDKEAPVIN